MVTMANFKCCFAYTKVNFFYIASSICSGFMQVIQCNMKIVSYLDVSFNLNHSNNKPFHKPNSKIIYIHKDSNHRPNILKQISTSTKKQISISSPRKTIFKESKETYQTALEKSGYRQTLKYHLANENVNNNIQDRKENIICFNTPFSVNVKAKVGNFFRNLIRKHPSPTS